MGPTSSVRSLRLRTSGKVSPEQFKEIIADFSKEDKKLAKHCQEVPPKTSVVADDEFSTCTITFSSEIWREHAEKAIRKTATLSDWVVDASFYGLTVFHAPQGADIDICGIHGLGGNAAGTFEAKNLLWLRDILPMTPPFKTARIMTYGYNAAVFDRTSLDRPNDWAEFLLHDLSELRSDSGTSDRPIILVCHSLGGIVARKAIVSLQNFPKSYNGIKKSDCGLLFLSTPHAGSKTADYPQLLTSFLASVANLRVEAVVKELESFNSSSVDNLKFFQHMEKIPPYECLCESLKTHITGKGDCELVTQASAGFLGKAAEKVPNVDHHSICKFDTAFDAGFRAVLRKLKSLREELTANIAPPTGQVHNYHVQPPGHPGATAFHFPLREEQKWYAGNLLQELSNPFAGRDGLMAHLLEFLNKPTALEAHTLIGMTGMAGVGKTALLLEIAKNCRAVYHIFAARASPKWPLDDEMYGLAITVGHDVLSVNNYPLAARAEAWHRMTRKEKLSAFSAWLKKGLQGRSLFLLDSIDDIKDPEDLRTALSIGAGITMYTSRNPYAFQGKTKKEIRLSLLDEPETMALLRYTIQQSELSRERLVASDSDLTVVAGLIDGHPLAACNAVYFMTQNRISPVRHFAGICRSDRWEKRKSFLDFAPHSGVSIMTCFEEILESLFEEQPVCNRLLHVWAFLTGDGLDPSDFIRIPRPWMVVLSEASLFYRDIFSMNEEDFQDCLLILERSSLNIDTSQADKLRLHPLLTECLRLRVSRQGRTFLLRQIILLAKISLARSEHSELMHRFLDNCYKIAKSFSIAKQDLENEAENEVSLVLTRISPEQQTLTQAQNDLEHRCKLIMDTLPSDRRFTSETQKDIYNSTSQKIVSDFQKLNRKTNWKNISLTHIQKHIELYNVLSDTIRTSPMAKLSLRQEQQLFKTKWADAIQSDPNEVKRTSSHIGVGVLT